MPPLFSQPHIVALRPSNGKDFTLNYGFQQSDFLWSFEPRKLSGENFIDGLSVAFKTVIL